MSHRQAADRADGEPTARLEAGVRVYHSIAGLDVRSRLSLSHGTERAVVARTGVPYAPGAFKPAGPWRALEDPELCLILGTGAPCPGSAVALIRMPPETLTPLYQQGLHEVRSKRDVDRLAGRLSGGGALIPLRREVERYARGDGGLVWHPLHCSPPHLETVTCFIGRSLLVGLHVDNWDAVPAEGAPVARNRVCINLGRHPRHFLCVNLTLEQVIRRACGPAPRSPAGSDTLRSVQAGVVRFFETHPRYPVLRLRVDPGEAYLAPTENLVHDASTVGSDFLSVDLTIRGHFSIGAPGSTETTSRWAGSAA